MNGGNVDYREFFDNLCEEQGLSKSMLLVIFYDMKTNAQGAIKRFLGINKRIYAAQDDEDRLGLTRKSFIRSALSKFR